jgi:hypothetical protein
MARELVQSPGADENRDRVSRLEQALDEQIFGLSQALSLFLACIVTFTSGLEIYMLSLIGLDMQCYWHIAPAEAATLFTVVFLVIFSSCCAFFARLLLPQRRILGPQPSPIRILPQSPLHPPT